MSLNHCRFVRGQVTLRVLGAALDQMGVAAGEAFWVGVEPPAPSENRVGPSVTGSSTSRSAALENYPRSGTQRRRVLEAIAFRGVYGATRDELESILGLSGSTIRPRVVELQAGGWITVVGSMTRRTRLGERAEVLMVTEYASAYGAVRDQEADRAAS